MPDKTAVKRNLLTPALGHFQIEIDRSLFLVGFEISVLVLVDRIEVAKLVEFDYRILPGRLVIDVAFIQQHFAAQHVVARKGVADELQATERKLFAFFNRDDEIDMPSSVWPGCL